MKQPKASARIKETGHYCGSAFSFGASFIPRARDGKHDLVVTDDDPPPEQRIPILKLKEDTCRWPIEGLFCGRKPVPGSPYCAGHFRRAHHKEPPGTTQHPQGSA